MKQFDIPNFFRILIIDDIIGSNPSYQEFIRNIFFSLAYKSISNNTDLNFEICFATRPDQGIKLWKDEIFDLTFIDADFTENIKHYNNGDALHYALNSKFQGINILSLFRSFVLEEGDFSHREKRCKFYLWSGLKRTDINDWLKTYNLKSRDFFWPKFNEQGRGSFNNIIKVIKVTIKEEIYDDIHKIERLLFALRKNYNNIHDKLFGGCLIYDEEDQFGFLPEIARVEDKSVRVCPGRIPPKLLNDSDENTKTIRFLPLHRRICEGNLRHTVRFLLNDEKNEIKNYCRQLKKRNASIDSEKHLPFFPSWDKNNEEPQNSKILGLPVKNQFIASASPLTGISVIGEERAREALKRKITALLNGPFGAVVLKTTYLDDPKQWENVFWPGLQIQTHMRTRCLYPDTGTPTLWNTGRTAVEMLPPASLNKFLLDISKSKWLKDKTHRIIISMGSKFPQTKSLVRCYRNEIEKTLKKIWKDFFELIFKNLPNDTSFPLIEINVRHYLREIIEYYLGGDEYLNPLGFEQKNEPDIEGFWNEFQIWLKVIHDLAVKYKKRLILKFPHRSDVLAYVRCAVALRELHLATCKEKEREYGIRGITLVNALKSPVPKVGIDSVKSTSALSNILFTPDWYANPDAWSDAQDKKFKYQMSGRFVGPYRNQILAGISSEFDRIKNLGMEIFVSGGITSRKDIEFIKALNKQNSNVISGIQIGTWGLLHTELGPKIKSWTNVSEPPKPARPDYIKFKLDIDSCKKSCCDVTLCPHGALGEKQKGEKVFFVNKELCDTCTTYDCEGKCISGEVKLKPCLEDPERIEKSKTPITHAGMSDADKNAILPRISFLNEKICKACGTCSHTFYCDSFIDRANDKLPPLMDSRNCSGCGLCVQVCSSGALQLYKPEEMLILISKSEERRDILRKLGIPFLAYDPDEDIANFSLDFHRLKEAIKEKITIRDINQLWDVRLNKDGYPPGSENRDRRIERKEACINTAKELIDKLQKETIDESKSVLLRAIVWSQLIWSDPGQIFWDSFIMTVRSYFCCDDGQYIGQMKMEDLSTQDKEIKIANYVVLLRKGEVVYRGILESKRFSISGIDKAMLKKYKEAGFNKDRFDKDRLGGLDLRTSSDFLLKNGKDIFKDDYSELLTCAGMPWQKLAQEIEEYPDKETREAFDRLKNAVARRTYN